MAKLTLDKNFTTRQELDAYVRSTFGEDINENSSITIEFSKAEQNDLMLATLMASVDDTTKIFGVKIKKLK